MIKFLKYIIKYLKNRENRCVFHKKYDIIYSIGRDCACAIYMQKARLRSYSGPFDWLTHGSFSDRMNLLLSDFQDFMNPSYFRLLEKNKDMFHDKECDYYENFKTKTFFFHDFPTKIPFQVSFTEVKKKYERRIMNFWNNIQVHQKVLLIWFFHGSETDDSEILRLCDLFCKKVGKTVDFLIIENNHKNKNPIKKELSSNIVKWILITEGISENENPTLGNEKQIQPIFDQYSLIVPFKIYLKRQFIKWLTKFICCFVPTNNLRKKMRKFSKKY